MSLILKTYLNNEWVEIARLGIGDRKGSISDNTRYGRDIYVFECLGEKSMIYKSKAGFDYEMGEMRDVNSSGFDVIAELSLSKPVYEMSVKTDSSHLNMLITFTHI